MLVVVTTLAPDHGRRLVHCAELGTSVDLLDGRRLFDARVPDQQAGDRRPPAVCSSRGRRHLRSAHAARVEGLVVGWGARRSANAAIHSCAGHLRTPWGTVTRPRRRRPPTMIPPLDLTGMLEPERRVFVSASSCDIRERGVGRAHRVSRVDSEGRPVLHVLGDDLSLLSCQRRAEATNSLNVVCVDVSRSLHFRPRPLRSAGRS